MKAVSISDIDVCLIVFNEADILKKCLDALLAAGFNSFVVLDMESTDNTLDVINATLSYHAKIYQYPRLSLLRYGYAEARNVCASFAKRDWVLCVDADEVLTGGCADGFVQLIEEKSAPVISIERLNLHLVDGQLQRASTERHNRLYRPSYNLRWDGYIHEEIHFGDTSAWLNDVDSALSFDHYRPLLGGYLEKKLGRYHLMLLRAFNQKPLRKGTNAWWYDEYVRKNIDAVRASAVQYAEEQHISPSFYEESLTSWTLEPTLDNRILRPVTRPQEDILSLQMLRNLHVLPSEPWTGKTGSVFWGEWNHPGEGSRNIGSIIEGYKINNWHRFIESNSICIDIGAHSGDTSIPMSLFALAKDEASRPIIVAVEPNPAVLPVLRTNLTLNHSLADFFIVEAAVTRDKVDEILITDHANALCNGGIRDGGFSQEVVDKLTVENTVSFNVRAITLTALITEINKGWPGRAISFIKMDCEGHDKEVIRSSSDILNNLKPVMFIEWFDLFQAEDSADLFEVIRSVGYLPFNPTTLQPADVGTKISDLLCFHKERCPIL